MIELTADEIFGVNAPAFDAGRDFPDTWRLLDDVEVMTLPDPEWIVADVIPRRGVGVIYAPSGAGKTTAIAGLLTAVATGRPWFGRHIDFPGPSIYVAAEDPSGFKMRLRAAKRAAGVSLTDPIGVSTFPEAIDLRDPVSVGRFQQFLKRSTLAEPPRIVCFDTYAASTPGASENSSEDTTTSMVHAQQLRDALGVTVVFAHHTNAGGTRERGHSAMRGAADFMVSLSPVDDAIHLECSKQRNAGPFERLVLKLVPGVDGEGCVLHLASDIVPTHKLSDAQLKAYAVLRDTFGADGATKTEWMKCCQDVPERTFYHASKVLAEQLYVKQIGSHFRITAKELPQ